MALFGVMLALDFIGIHRQRKQLIRQIKSRLRRKQS